ncbi:VOC family protein [Flagellimonas sp. HMM57]|uniref:VOC family protein n=1 Tax=unclassified Flagellimonas TaxID=2644544 RepID=UPI0013D5FBEF|nr:MULTISPECIES: VOC family protein [unclassified Flagellimonas]UII76046.1 VOC family protein [Flagellimonas sp. HMM57]
MEEINRQIANVTLVVKDYDEAIAFYTKKLGFELVDDVDLGEGKRWVLVAPKGSQCNILLGKAANNEQKAAIGNQTGGRVFLFLNTADFWKDYRQMQKNGILFKEEPREESYGTVVVFEDLYGNLWDLLQLK